MLLAGLLVAPRGQLQPSIGFVEVPGGTFLMGTDPATIPALKAKYAVGFPGVFEDETPVHPVTLSPFRIDADEVTNARFARFVAAVPAWRKAGVPAALTNGHYLEDWTGDAFPEGGENRPVAFVTWHAAQAFCGWAGGRLPTEAQWEFAARAGGDIEFPWGDAPPSPDRANYSAGARGSTVDVERFPPNALGLYDLAGNVWEWALDAWEDQYPGAPQSDPIAGGPVPDDSLADVSGRRVIRGGSYAGAAINLRTRWRDSHPVTNAVAFVGFRCAYPTQGP